MKTISKLILITISLFGFGATQVNSQSWVRKYHAPGEGFRLFDQQYNVTRGNSVVVDATGNVYVTGTYDYQGFYERNQITTIKYNSAGVEQWVKRYSYYNGNLGHGPTNDIGVVNALDASGNIIVSGVCDDGYQNQVIATISYSPNGIQNWIRIYGDSWSNGGFYSKSVTGIVVQSNKVYITGSKNRADENTGLLDADMLVLGYNSTDGSNFGTWPQTFGGNGDDEATAICVGADLFLYVTGYKTNADKDVVMLRYTLNGALPYSGIQYNSGSDDIPASIAVSHLGNVMVVGKKGNDPFYDYLILHHSYGSTSFQEKNYGFDTQNNDEATSVVNQRYNSFFYITGSRNGNGFGLNSVMTTFRAGHIQGEYISGVSFNRYSNGSDHGRKVKMGNNGDVYVCGHALNPNTGFTDYSVFRYDWTLSILKAKGFYNGTLGPGSSMDKAYDMCIDASGRPIVTGYSEEKNLGSHITTYKYPKYFRRGLFDIFIEGLQNNTNLMAYNNNYQLVLRPITGGGDIGGSLEKDTIGEGKWEGLIWADSIPNTQYYIGIKGHNIIETWSSVPVSFNGDSINFNFTTSQSQAFGNNLTLVGSKWCIYSGDVNQDGTIDASDASEVDNDAITGEQGNYPTDLNGDDFVDASDLSIVDNNAAVGIFVFTP